MIDLPVIDPDGRVLHTPMPDDPATEVTGNLWVGACALDAGGATDPNDYVLIVTLCSRSEETLFTPSGPQHIRFPMSDGPDLPDPTDLAGLVHKVIRTVRRGPVLLRCWAGVNRSGLVAALAMIELDQVSGTEALRTLRAERSRFMLCNPAFRDLVHGITEPALDPAQARRLIEGT